MKYFRTCLLCSLMVTGFGCANKSPTGSAESVSNVEPIPEPARSEFLAVLKALEEGWTPVGKEPQPPGEDYLEMINESRDVKDDLKPKLDLLKQMESKGLIQKEKAGGATYGYVMTEKGKQLLKSGK